MRNSILVSILPTRSSGRELNQALSNCLYLVSLQEATVDDLHMLRQHNLLRATTVCAAVRLCIAVRDETDEQRRRRVEHNARERAENNHPKNKGSAAEDPSLCI